MDTKKLRSLYLTYDLSDISNDIKLDYKRWTAKPYSRCTLNLALAKI